MNHVAMTLNGRKVSDSIEARLTLADFVRDRRALTGTHLGCEHGACGACTVHIDGEPVRSCTVFAATCDGKDVRTIEGFENDALMNAIRKAFSEEHGLQCGFCTPGMLMSAYDIVTRLRDPDERRVRMEISGNLCRCTGYMGIVKAITRVIAERNGSPNDPSHTG